MKARSLSRRHFLALAPCAVAGCAVSETSSDAAFQRGEPGLWAAPGRVDASFPSGVQTGDVTASAALVSLRTQEPQVSLSLVKAVDQRWEPVGEAPTFSVDDGSVQLELDDLQADTSYALAFYAADGVRRSGVARFRTALAPGASRVVRFGASSCFGSSNSPFPCVRHAARQRLDFFMLLGDTIYADKGPDKYQFRKKFNTALSTTGLSALTSSTSIIAAWDDHEIDNNWSWDDENIEASYAEALAAYREALPQRIGPSGGVWRKQSWGDVVDVFVLDVRSERLDGRYISAEQMQWLQAGLASSEAMFKMVMTPVPIFDFHRLALGPFSKEDRWEGHPSQRDEILEHVRDNDISGVVWVSGDIHYGAVGRVDAPGGPGDNQWEVIAGPAGSSINPITRLLNGTTEREPVIVKQHNWVQFDADPERAALQVRFIGNDGSTVGSQMLRLD